MPNYSLPAKVSVAMPRDLPIHSRFFFFSHRILYANDLRVALRYFQALELHEVLRVYQHVCAYADRYELATPFLREVQEYLRGYLEWCLLHGWCTFPIQNPKQE